LKSISGGTGPLLEYQGGAVTAGEFGAGVAPVAARPQGGDYLVVWSLGGNQYTVWNTDANGNYISSAAGILSNTSTTMESLEVAFTETFSGGGSTGSIATTPIGTNALLSQIGNVFELKPTGSGTGPLLEYQGGLVTAGEFGSTVAPVEAVKTATGYEVAWSLGGNQYTVWNTDANGNYTTSATGAVYGQSFALEDLETTFGEDLNGDGKLSAVLVTTGTTVNLTSQTQPTTINLGANTASAALGLNAPSLTFIGTQDAITLGSKADIVEYALAPSSGIETIANFVLGTDELNIDLMGGANSLLQAYNTTVGGVNAIAIASSADPAHGLVLLNLSGGLTAASLLSSTHTTFIDGHALIS
jgi:hypothetical protein